MLRRRTILVGLNVVTKLSAKPKVTVFSQPNTRRLVKGVMQFEELFQVEFHRIALADYSACVRVRVHTHM